MLKSVRHRALPPPDPPRQSLFRRQVLEAQQARSSGAVLVLNPFSHSLLVAVFSALALSLIAFVFLFGFHRKVAVAGAIAPDLGLIAIRAPQAGVIEARLVAEGQEVRQGQPLFRISGERASVALGDTEAALGTLLRQRRESLAADLSRVRQQALDRRAMRVKRLNEALGQLDRLDGELLLQQRRVDLASAEYQRSAALRTQGFLSEAGLQDKEATLLEQRLRWKELDGARRNALRDRSDLEGDIATDGTQSVRDLGVAQRAIGEVDTEIAENEAGRDFLIKAPVSGSIDVLNANVGDPVGASEALAAMVPTGARLEALLYAPSSAAGFIHPGMQVLLRYQSFPFQKFGQARGRVTAVANAAVGDGANGATSGANAGEPVYRVRVALEHQDVLVAGSAVPLKAGMRLDASVVLEQRRLIEWILEPIYALRGRL